MRSSFVLLFCCVLSGCSSYKFSKESVFVNDVDEYFNHSLKLNVWTYMNFYPHQDGERTGVRLHDFYENDVEVLKKIGLKSKGSKVLFSAVPSGLPHYNLLALVHNKPLTRPEEFERRDVNKEQFYLEKDYVLGQLDIRHVVIPFEKGKKTLSLVYYINMEEHQNCRFCKLEYLAKINTSNLQDSKKQYRDNWLIAENISDTIADTEIKVPEGLDYNQGKIFLKLFAQYETQTGINYFHILDAKSKDSMVKVKLPPNRYFLEYENEQRQIIYRDTIQVKL